MTGSRTHGVTGVHDILPLIMSTGLLCHGADDGQFVRLFGKIGQQTGDLDPICIGFDGRRDAFDFGVGLGVEGIDVAHAAIHVDKDNVLRLWVLGGYVASSGGGGIHGSGHYGDAKGSGGDSGEKFAAIQFIKFQGKVFHGEMGQGLFYKKEFRGVEQSPDEIGDGSISTCLQLFDQHVSFDREHPPVQNT